jgi:hypothetical protein
MDYYAGIDVSLEASSLCVVDASGTRSAGGISATNQPPEAERCRQHSSFERERVGQQKHFLLNTCLRTHIPPKIAADAPMFLWTLGVRRLSSLRVSATGFPSAGTGGSEHPGRTAGRS